MLLLLLLDVAGVEWCGGRVHGVRTLVGHRRAGKERGSGVFVVHSVEGPGNIVLKRACDNSRGRCASEWASPVCTDGESSECVRSLTG